MGDAIAIVSVISGAAVAILVPLITAAVQSGERLREHRRERVARLREVLVKCCSDLADASTSAINAARKVGVSWEIEVEVAEAQDVKSSFALFRERLHVNYRTHLVLVLELGPGHDVCQAFGKAADALLKLQVPLVDARSAENADALRERIHDDLYSYRETESEFHQVASKLLREEERGERAFRLRNPFGLSRGRGGR